jgi:hypothetical protein
VDGLAYRLDWPTNCGCQVRVHSLLTGTVLSCCTMLAGATLDHLLGGRGGGGCEAPQDGPSDSVLIARVPDGLDSLWRILLLPG